MAKVTALPLMVIAVGTPLSQTKGPLALALPVKVPLVVMVPSGRLVVQSALKPLGAVAANGRCPALREPVVADAALAYGN